MSIYSRSTSFVFGSTKTHTHEVCLIKSTYSVNCKTTLKLYKQPQRTRTRVPRGCMLHRHQSSNQTPLTWPQLWSSPTSADDNIELWSENNFRFVQGIACMLFRSPLRCQLLSTPSSIERQGCISSQLVEPGFLSVLQT